MKINIHQMIRANLVPRVLNNRYGSSNLQTKSTHGATGIEVLDLQKHNTPHVEKLASYASLRRKNKEKTQFIRIVSVVCCVSILINIMLLAWSFYLYDSMIWHTILEHNMLK